MVIVNKTKQMNKIWKHLLILLLANYFIRNIYSNSCAEKSPLFANEILQSNEIKLPTTGMVLWDSSDSSPPTPYTVTEFVRLQNGSACQPPRNGALYEIATGSDFPLKLYCTNNGTFIFAESRAVGEPCQYDEHCVSKSSFPVRCLNNRCQSVPITLLEKNTACSIRDIKFGYHCGVGLTCETKITNTCQQICSTDNPCPTNMECIENDLNQTVCIPLQQVGEVCSIFSELESNCISGAYCFTTPENNTCTPKAREGQSCYAIYPFVSCEKGYECDSTCKLLPDLGQSSGGLAGN